ncbi:hypothetical protein GS507_25765 [Rhodococcus hoagii]|nr:hypothetical protein [Prescottella equi]
MPARRPEPRTLAEPLTSVTGKRQFRRGVALPEGRVAPLGGASSHLVAAMAASDVLIDVPTMPSPSTSGHAWRPGIY